MNKAFWKEFFGWLDRATLDELKAAKTAAREEQGRILDPAVRSDLKRMIRLIEEEILTRGDLSGLIRR